MLIARAGASSAGWPGRFVAKLLTAATPGRAANLPNFDTIAARPSRRRHLAGHLLLGMRPAFMDSSKPDDAAVKEIIAGLKGSTSGVIPSTATSRYPEADVDSVRKQLSAPARHAWCGHNSPDHSNVEIDICTVQVALRPAIIASDPTRVTIVKIVGLRRSAEAAPLQGKFGIP